MRVEMREQMQATARVEKREKRVEKQASGKAKRAFAVCGMGGNRRNMQKSTEREELEVRKAIKNALCLAEKLAELLETANTHIPLRISALQRVGNLLFSTGDWEKALEICGKRLELASRLSCVRTLMEVHSDLVKLYKSLGDMKNRQKYIEEEAECAKAESGFEWIYFEDLADLKADHGELEEAAEIYEKALMGVQEQNNPSKEAGICAKLGDLHIQLESYQEASFYYQQNLALNKQTKNLGCVLKGYASLGKIQFLQNLFDEALEFRRYQLTIARILNDTPQKLDALIGIGRIFIEKKDYGKAVRIFSKVRRSADSNYLKSEVALSHGYIGQCYVELNDRSRALSHFCKQLALFPHISDFECKCSTLAHLISEKSIAGDIIWTLKLCEMRVDIAKKSKSVQLQVNVLYEAADTVILIGCHDKATHYLSEAVALGLEHQLDNATIILLKLADLYERLGQYENGVKILENFVENVDNGLEFQLRLVAFLFHQQEFPKAEKILRSLEQGEEVLYALATSLYRQGNLYEALTVIQSYSGRTEPEYIAVNIRAGHLFEAIRKLEDIAYWEDLREEVDVIRRLEDVFDDLDAFDVINPNKLDDLSLNIKIHYEMSLGNWDSAFELLEMENAMEFEKFVVSVFTGHELAPFPKPSLLDSKPPKISFSNTLTPKLKEKMTLFLNALLKDPGMPVEVSCFVLYRKDQALFYVKKLNSKEVLPQFHYKMIQSVLEFLKIPLGTIVDIPMVTKNEKDDPQRKPTDVCEILKSFEIREKWRRKGRRKPRSRSRGYASEGEIGNLNNTTISDCELTDTESVSGAKVLGVDFEEGEDGYESTFNDASFAY
ncbi:hypothetical protein L596_024962 [Steinernema carpocapsae]|uniref:MalT-like TPR region domain-containing protein n=1 Tax=Steinernema carpocapsae TaxID=34508 RepID=A0A4U5M6J2_STECR|nr:hypothetical protein L596_024962 [Steinernema carpocapsae]